MILQNIKRNVFFMLNQECVDHIFMIASSLQQSFDKSRRS